MSNRKVPLEGVAASTLWRRSENVRFDEATGSLKWSKPYRAVVRAEADDE
jgi:hypothetical protein